MRIFAVLACLLALVATCEGTSCDARKQPQNMHLSSRWLAGSFLHQCRAELVGLKRFQHAQAPYADPAAMHDS